MGSVKHNKGGIYPATYNFEGETSLPDAWDDEDDGGGNCHSEMVSEYKGHRYVIRQRDNSNGNSARVNQTFTAGAQDSGCVELWGLCHDYYAGVSQEETLIYLYDGATIVLAFLIEVHSGKFRYYDGSWNDIAGPTPSDDEWHHVSIEFNNSGGNIDLRGDGNLADHFWRVYIDDVEYGDYALANNNSPDRIKLETGASGYVWGYWDAIGYDWDGSYSIGDNRTLEYVTITESNIKKLQIHNPTTLKPARVKFGNKNYERWYPIAVAHVHKDEAISLGTTIEVTENHTSAGSTASEVVFKGEVVKKLVKRSLIFLPQYLIFSNGKEMDDRYPEGSYTKDTDGYISDILTNDCDKLTEGTLSDGEDLGTFTVAGDKNFTSIIRQCAKIDGFIGYVDPANGADNADLMYNDGSTDTGIDIDESSSTLRGLLSVEDIDEHINYVMVRGGIQSDGTRAESTAAEDSTSQDIYGIIPFYDVDTTLNTDALCTTKASAILAENEYGRKIVKLRYLDTAKGMLQHGENVTFDWDSSVKDIGFDIAQDQFIIALNVFDYKSKINTLTLMSGIYYPPQSTDDIVQETSHLAMQNAANIATKPTIYTDKAAAPGVNDDVDLGYVPGDIWIDTTNHDIYMCEDNSDGAANWLQLD